MSKTKLFALLAYAEGKGVAFWNRNSDNTITLWVRNASWNNANVLMDKLGALALSCEPDPQSGHIRISINARSIYGN